jgi:hypothetical protein
MCGRSGDGGAGPLLFVAVDERTGAAAILGSQLTENQVAEN